MAARFVFSPQDHRRPVEEDVSHQDAEITEIPALFLSALCASVRALGPRNHLADGFGFLIDLEVLPWVVESGHKDFIRLGQALGVTIHPEKCAL